MARQQVRRNRQVQNRYYQREHYIDGTTARKLQAVPEYTEYGDYDDDYEEERRRKQETYQEKKRKERARRRNREQTKTMSGISLVFLVGAIALTFVVCIQYLQVQSDMTSLSKSVASKESLVANMRKDNNAALEEISRKYDLNYVYKVATKKLGMVFPNKDQVIKYESKKSDYVKKFEEIPSDKKAK